MDSNVLDAIGKAFKKVVSLSGAGVLKLRNSLKYTNIRNVGHSVFVIIRDFVSMLIDQLKNFVSPLMQQFIKFVQEYLFDVIVGQYQKCVEMIFQYAIDAKSWCILVASGFVACCALALPQESVSSLGRCLMIAMSVISIIARSWQTTIIGGMLTAVLVCLKPQVFRLSISTNYQDESSDFSADFKSWASSAVLSFVLISLCIKGMTIPEDNKSLDELLKRSALVGRSYLTWTMIGGKISDFIEETYKMVVKYFYKEEYVSAKHLPDVRELFKRVMKLSTLEEAHRIQNEPEKMAEVEAMYLLYQQYLQMYGNDPELRQELQQIGSVITYFYKQVVMKNPRSYVMRQEPVCVVFTGASGVGKSYLMNPFQQDLAKMGGLVMPGGDFSGLVYSRCVEHDFWDGYAGQKIVLYDDFAQQVDSQVKPNLEFFEIIRTVNIFPYQCHSAALEQKANNAFRAQFVILTTNLKSDQWDVKSIIEPEAFKRRMHMIYETSLIDEVSDLTGKLDVLALLSYREANGLGPEDMSHYRFKDVRTGADLTYEQMIVAVSKQYERNIRSFEERTHISEIKARERLPPGAFSVDACWQYQEELVKVPLLDYISTTPLNREKLKRTCEIVASGSFAIAERFDTLENMIEFYRLHPPVGSDKISEGVLDQIDQMLVDGQVGGDYLFWRMEMIRIMRREYHARNDPSASRIKTELQANWDVYSTQKLLILWSAVEKFVSRAQVLYMKVADLTKYFFKVVFAISGCVAAGALIASLVRGKRACVSKTSVIATLVKRPVDCVALASECGFTAVSTLTHWLASHFKVHSDYVDKCNECDKARLVALKIEEKKVTIENAFDVSKLEQVFAESPHRENVARTHNKYESPHRENVARSHLKYEGNAADDQVKRLQRIAFVEQQLVKYNKFSTTGSPTEQEKYDKLVELKILDSSYSEPTPKSIQWIQDASQAEGDCGGVEESDLEEIRSLFPRNVKFVPEAPLSKQTQELYAVMRRNMYNLFLEIKENNRRVRIGLVTMIKGHKCLINFHFIQRIGQYVKTHGVDGVVLLMTPPEQEEGFEVNIASIATATPIYRGSVKTEFCMWTTPKAIPLARDISKYMVHPNDYNKLHTGVRLSVVSYTNENGNYRSIVREGEFAEFYSAELQDVCDPNKSRLFPMSVRYNIATQAGDCGAPVLINDTAFGKVLVGFHFGGASGMGIASSIAFRDVEKHLKKENEGHLIGSLSGDEVIVPQCDSDESFPLKGSFRHIAQLENPVVQSVKTKLCPSSIHGFFGPSTVSPARLGLALDLEGPMIRGLSKNAGRVILIDEDLAWNCVLSYGELLSIIRPNTLEQRVLSFEDACRGVEGEMHFPPLKRSKSAGWPWMVHATVGKEKWLGKDEWDFTSEDSLQLRKAVEEMENTCRQGIVPEVYFVDTLKDEKRPLEKVLAGKTRVFSAAPLHFSILFRKYFLGFIAYVSRSRYTNESAVGTNVYSTDWAMIARRMSQYSEMTDGDFENFDGTVNFYLFDKILSIVNDFYADGEQNARVRAMIWESLTRAGHILHSFVYLMSHGQPSGNPGTAPFNSIYVSLVIRYVLGKMGYHPRSFNNFFRLTTYGDDFFLSYSHSVSLDLEKFTDTFQTIGMKVTDSGKQSKCVLKRLSDISFLKRRFVYDGNYDWWFAPLALESIVESCNWVRTSLPRKRATLDNIAMAQYELFHHDEETFERVKDAIQTSLRERNIGTIFWKSWKAGRLAISNGKIMDEIQSMVCV